MLPQTLGTYVYLSTLTEIDPDFAKEAKSYSTFNPSNSINAKGEAIHPIINAISQLTNIAGTQEQIERQAVKNYLNKLNWHLKHTEMPSSLRSNLERQINKINTMSFENYQTDQLNLIQAINIAIQNIDSFERRLNQITTPVIKPGAFNARLEFNIQQRLEAFFENMGKKQAVGRNAKYIRRDKKMSDMLDKEFDKLFNNFPELKNELKALLYIDFNNWIENNSLQRKSYTSLTDEDIERFFNEYIQLQENNLTETHLQRLINSSSKDLVKLAQDMQKILHSQFLNEEDIKILQTKYDSNSDKISFKNQTLTRNQVKNLITSYEYQIENNEQERFSFTFHSSVSHGNFYEFFKTVISSAVNIEGNVAGDLILPIGTATFTEHEQKEQQELMKLSNDLQSILTKDFKQRQQLQIDEMNQAIEKEQTLSKELQNKINLARENLTQLNELNEQFFIAHESTKLYRGAEQKDSKFWDFHGRDMAIMQALAKLYASPILSNNMINPDNMLLYLINISDATLAVNQKPLETYLSLFAGLLMFDDISTLAQTNIQEIQNNISTSTVQAIHVYNVGGVYFPISVILKNLITQMNEIINYLHIDYGKTAVAVITGPTPSAPEESSTDAWSSLANDTIKETRIQIHFLAGFTQYVSELFNNFK